jgi:Ca2+-transporting ATPase
MPADEVRALAFFSLVIAIIGLIFVNRSFDASPITALRRPNPALAWVMAAVAAVLASTLVWPFARDLFRFGPLHLDDIVLTLGAGIIVLIALELIKTFWRTPAQVRM